MVEAWRAGDRPRALEAAPEELIREVFVLGDPSAQRARLEEFRALGVTCPVLLIAGVEAADYGGAVEALAPG